METISRQQSGLEPPAYVNRIYSSEGIYVHHSAGPESQTVKQIQNYHKHSLGWSDIAYSFLVDNRGLIYVGRGWGVAGGHTYGYNSRSHAVCYIGNTDEKDAPAAAKRAINTVILEHNRRYGAGYVRPHNAVNQTSCPGKGLTAWVNAGRPGGSSSTSGTWVLKRGSKGLRVAALQVMLVKLGQRVWVSGNYDYRTVQAVKHVQEFVGIPTSGTVGAWTFAGIQKLVNYFEAATDPKDWPLTLNDRGRRVASVNTMLRRSFNQDTGDSGNKYTKKTQKAVANATKFLDIRPRPYGNVYADTYQAIRKWDRYIQGQKG